MKIRTLDLGKISCSKQSFKNKRLCLFFKSLCFISTKVVIRNKHRLDTNTKTVVNLISDRKCSTVLRPSCSAVISVIRKAFNKSHKKLVCIQQTFVLMKTSWRLLSSSSSEDVFKTSSRRICFPKPYVFRRRLSQDQYIRLGHTASRRLQDVFKTSYKDIFKTFSRRIIKLNCSC